MEQKPGDNEGQKLYEFFYAPLRFVGLLWAIMLFGVLTGFSLDYFGIMPRTLFGLIGIIAAPLIHANFAHLISNTLPLLVLGWMLLYFYPQSSRMVFVSVYIVTGIFVWLFARPSIHIGASGIIYGLAFFILVSSFLRNDNRSLAIAFFVIFMYGGLIWGVFPGQEGISWESHLGGAITGIVMAFVCRDMDKPEKEDPPDNDEEHTGSSNYKYTYIPKEKD